MHWSTYQQQRRRKRVKNLSFRCSETRASGLVVLLTARTMYRRQHRTGMVRTSHRCGEYFGYTTATKRAYKNIFSNLETLNPNITHRCVEYDVWGLDNAALRIEKNSAKQQNFLHGIGVSQNNDLIAHVERMFDEEKDYTGQYFLKAAADQPRQP